MAFTRVTAFAPIAYGVGITVAFIALHAGAVIAISGPNAIGLAAVSGVMGTAILWMTLSEEWFIRNDAFARVVWVSAALAVLYATGVLYYEYVIMGTPGDPFAAAAILVFLPLPSRGLYLLMCEAIAA